MKTGALALPASPTRVADFLALTKPRLNSLVVVTAGVGFYLGSTGALDLVTLLHAVLGSALVAGGAAAFNQVSERDIDETMERTRRRPIPAGRIQPSEARMFATVLAVVGTAELALATNWLATVVALVALVSYVAIYTPLKRWTPWATLVGAVPGALPPMIGWAAARGELNAGAWVLFCIVFLWQLPHFHALAWMYREDFRRANIPLVAVLDRDGSRTSTHALVYTIALLPISLTPAAVALSGGLYVIGASAAGIAFLFLAVRFALRHSADRARALFLGSLIYLPVLWSLLVVERVF
ncbi:MAG: heme o synthase [Vicinamibacterales bacterium]